MRPFNQIKEQIRTLHNRGIKIDTLSKYRYTKQYLLTNNYYNLVNGYGRVFFLKYKLLKKTKIYLIDTIVVFF